MPPAQVLDAAQYRFQSGERILVDSSIWLDVYGPEWLRTSTKRLSISSLELLQRCQIAGCLIYSDPLIYSEVVHRVVRIGYERTGSKLSYKDWRTGRDADAVVKKAH